MPWYKAGTVSVTLNSNAVTGTGTAFIVNCRVGDAFRGPDGRWYEVTNVASNTAISIDPPYIGSTASGGSYALAPMQGYVKESADALRAIVTSYGAQMAALKTTGNYDVLPVTKGGTGGTTQAEARTGLGLGTAATVNAGATGSSIMGAETPAAGRTSLGLGTAATATLSESRRDATLGRVLKVGDHGIGAESLETITGTLIDDIRTNGFYYVASGVNQGSAPSFTNGYLWSKSVTSVYAIQSYYVLTNGFEYKRVLNNGTWGAWKLCYDSTSAVGTVSQSGGVSTGAVVERGSNGNGQFVKYADGTLIQWGASSGVVDTSVSSLYGSTSGVMYATTVTVSLPSTFISTTTYGVWCKSVDRGVAELTISKTTTSFGVQLRHQGNGSTVSFDFLAIGRWY